MTTQELRDLDDAQFIDLGVVSEQTEGSGDGNLEDTADRSEP